jgi:hypothetical protein
VVSLCGCPPRALNLLRSIPAHRLTPVLDFALGAPTLPAKKNAKGLSLSASTSIRTGQVRRAA